MKFAVIGCGSIGRRHIANLLSLGHEVVAFNRGAERRARAAHDFAIPVYDDRDAMLAEAGASAAVVCSPNSCHLDDAVACAEAGLHMLIEKPVVAASADAAGLAALVAGKGLVVHSACNMRFHRGPARLKELVAGDALGEVLWAGLWAGMYLPDWHPDEDYRQMYSARRDLAGGALMDFIHEFDLLLWLFGEPGSVAAMVRRSGHLEIETEDTVDLVCDPPGAGQVTLHVDYLQRPPRRAIHIVGTKAGAVWDLMAGRVEIQPFAAGGPPTIEADPPGYDRNAMYLEQARYFISCIEAGRASSADLAAGVAAVRLAERARTSSLERRFA